MYEPNGGHYEMMGGNGWMVGIAVVTLVLLLVAVGGVLVNVYLHSTRTPSSPRRTQDSPGSPSSAPRAGRAPTS